jgi:hypothetical protein
MRAAFPRRLNPGRPQPTADVTVEILQWAIGSTRPNEDLSPVGRWPTTAQIIEQRFADQRHQWQERARTGLGVADPQGFSTPVDVLDGQVADFARP